MFIQNFRPGVAEKLGAGEAELRALNPRLIYCAISGFGTSGPARDRPAFDTVAQAASGFLRLVVPPDRPRVIGPAIADAITGFYAAFGVLAALSERAATGNGRRVDVSMLEAMCHFNLDSFTHYFSVGEIMTPLSRPSVSQSYVFECADGKWLALHMSSPEKFWESLAEVHRQAGFAARLRASRPGPSRIAHQDDLIEVMGPIFRTRGRATNGAPDWRPPACPIRRLTIPTRRYEDPQARHLHIQVEAEHPRDGALPHGARTRCRSTAKPDLVVTPPPVLDEHGAEIRDSLREN